MYVCVCSEQVRARWIEYMMDQVESESECVCVFRTSEDMMDQVHDGSGAPVLLVEVHIGTIFLERTLEINFKKFKPCQVLCYILCTL